MASTLESIFDKRSPDGHFERPRLARAFAAVANYWRHHWKFTINTFIAIAAIIVAAYVAINYGK
jgi:hypothetical protein